MNSRPGVVIAEKVPNLVLVVTSSEKEETITVIACCNAEGISLSPIVVMKGVNKEKRVEGQHAPRGSILVM